jgi:hypothetical protein
MANYASRKGITRSDLSPIEDAYRRDLPPCPKCGASKGDPCRSPKGKTIKAHSAREFIEGAARAILEKLPGRGEEAGTP